MSFMQGMMQGYEFGNKMLKDYHTRKAGESIASGDEQGGINRMLRTGDISGALNYQTTTGNNARAQTYADVAQGQFDLNKIKTERGWKDEDIAKSLAFISDTSDMLQNVLRSDGPEGVLAAYDQIIPVLKVQGTSDEEIATYREQLAVDPERFLTAMSSTAKEQMKLMTATPGSWVIDPTDKSVVAKVPFAEKTVTAGEGQRVFVHNPNTGATNNIGGAAPASQASPEAKFDDFYTNYLADVEGGFVESDGRSGAPANYGVNQAANPDIDVASLTPEEAKQVLYERYYVRSGADKLPEPLASIHADTAINAGVETAQRMLKNSNGDPEAYLQARQQYYESLDQPENMPSWNRRQEKLRQRVQGMGGIGPSAPALPLVAEGAPKAQDKFRPLTAEEKTARDIPENVSAEINERTGKVQVVYNPPAGSSGGSGQIKLSPQDAGYLRNKRQEYSSMAATLPEAKEFMELNRTKKTGGLMGSEMVANAAAAFDSTYGRMKAITDKLTPAMRQGLPGAASDRDVAMFRSATMNLGRTRESNEATYRAYAARVKREGQYIEFMEAYAQQNGNLLGAQELWNDYVNSYSLFSDDTTEEDMSSVDGVPKLNRNIPHWRDVIPGFAKNEGNEYVWDPVQGKAVKK